MSNVISSDTDGSYHAYNDKGADGLNTDSNVQQLSRDESTVFSALDTSQLHQHCHIPTYTLTPSRTYVHVTHTHTLTPSHTYHTPHTRTRMYTVTYLCTHHTHTVTYLRMHRTPSHTYHTHHTHTVTYLRTHHTHTVTYLAHTPHSHRHIPTTHHTHTVTYLAHTTLTPSRT